MTDPGGIVHINPEPTDAEFAKQVKQRVGERLAALIEEMNIAAGRSMEVRFSIQIDARGRAFLHQLDVLRKF